MKKINTILFDFDRTLRFPLLSWEDFTFQFLESIGIYLSIGQKNDSKRWVYYYFQSNEFLTDRAQEEDGNFWTAFYQKYTRNLLHDEIQAAEMAPVLQEKVTNDCFPNYKDYVPEGSRQILNFLRQEGYKLGIITNRSHSIDEELNQLELAEFFPQVIVSGIVGSIKPQPEIFKYALEQIDSIADQSIYIGDNYYADVLGAINAGMQPILIDPDRIFPEAECPVITSLAELPALLVSFSQEN